jgi:hypothetical protein
VKVDDNPVFYVKIMQIFYQVGFHEVVRELQITAIIPI